MIVLKKMLVYMNIAYREQRKLKEETKRQTVSPDRVEESGEIQRQTLTKVYASSLYYLELNTAKMLCDLDVAGRIDEEKAVRKIHKIEKRKEFVLDDLQRRAVLEAIRRGILILTGGPGTGKTTSNIVSTISLTVTSLFKKAYVLGNK